MSSSGDPGPTIVTLLRQIDQLRRERDTLDRFAFAPTWDWFKDMPDPWDGTSAFDDAMMRGETLRKAMRAAGEAAPSLDELLAREAARDG